MTWSETIVLDRPLKNVALVAQAPQTNWDVVIHTQEQAAYERGRRDGESGLGAQLIQQRNEIVELQRGILTNLNGAVSQVIHESQSACIQLALEAAGRIVAGYPIDSGLVEAVVREALAQVEDSTEITVQVHPEDLALLQKNDSSLLGDTSEKSRLRFVPSSQVNRGGCLVQTRFGVIDAQREVKLRQLAETVSV